MSDRPDDKAGEQLRPAIPLLGKIGYSFFLFALIPPYLASYGPANFLWFCNIALLVTLAALWLESSFLASMQLVAIFLGQLFWIADFLSRLVTGVFLTRMTVYMFREDIPLFLRLLSLYHIWLPFLLLWMVWRLGYDSRAWLAQCLLAWAVLPICFFYTDPVRALNGVFGPSGEHPQQWLPPWLFLILVMLFYPVCLYLPSHLVFRALFHRRPT